MKKLIIIAVVTLGIFVANAAVCSWEWKVTSALTDYNGVTLSENIAVSLYAEGISDAIYSSVTTSESKVSSVFFNTDTALLSDESSYDFYITYTDSINGYTYKSAAITKTPSTTGEGSLFFTGKYTGANGTWTSNVPEPTSGLLLLCGLAGLALRRKKA